MISVHELRTMAQIMEEAAGHVRALLADEDESGLAIQLQVREWLPDELEGSAIMLRDMAKEMEDGATPRAGS